MTAFNRPTLVTITSPTCSGKSYLLNEVTSRGLFSRIVSTTTRAQRPGERVGVDYDYITMKQSLAMEANGELFELIEFNGTRYGVTNDQMARAMACAQPPVVILEPQGLEIYGKKCAEHGWDIFRIYVHVTESVRLERLLQRSLTQSWDVIDNLSPAPGRYTQAFFDVGSDSAKRALAKILDEHQRRLLSITGNERRWSNQFNWDAIVPGDDVEKAVEMIEQGIRWRNRKTSEPQAIGAVKLPL